MTHVWTIGILEVGVIPGLHRSLYDPHAGAGEIVDVPCYVFLLRRDSTAVLVDTGPDAAAAREHGYEIVGETRSQLLSGLAEHELTPAGIDLVVHTHLHYDHCQNDALFTQASVVVQQAELRHARSGDRFYEGVPELCEELGARLDPISGDMELAPGLHALLNGGHTPGHQSILVDTAEGRACICGDIVSLNCNTRARGSVCPDREETERFLRRAAQAGWQMIPSHEPDLRAHPWFVPA